MAGQNENGVMVPQVISLSVRFALFDIGRPGIQYS
jgi:hypothetical protein